MPTPVITSSSEMKAQELSREIRRLGAALGKAIETLEGPAVLQTVEELRALAKASRGGDAGATGKLKDGVGALDTHEAFEVAMAFTTYFELVNLAEENFRISILRERRARREVALDAGGQPLPPERESIESAIEELKRRGVTPAEMQKLLDQLGIELVFTAHPTESKRRTMLTKLKRLAAILRHHAAPTGDSFFLNDDRQIEREITSLWLTDRSRTNRPEVEDEVRTGLWYFDTTLWDILPFLQENLVAALAKHYPGVKAPRRWMTFGSWIGGDRDGNPNVTARVSASSLVLHRRLALDKLRQGAHQISRLLTISARRDRISSKLQALINKGNTLSGHAAELAARYPNEPYRVLFGGLRLRLAQAFEEATTGQLLELSAGAPPPLRGAEINEVLETVAESLGESRASALAGGELEHLRRKADVFGVHLAKLDMRQHSSRHEAAIAELFAGLGLAAVYPSLDEDAKVALLGRVLGEPAPAVLVELPKWSDTTRDVLEPLALAARAKALYGPEAVGIYIISMTDAVSDVLEALVLQYFTGSILSIAPLFETLDDLERAPGILSGMFNHPGYRKHLAGQGDHQTVMLGYSDSNKDCGYITANWALFQAQESIAKTCSKAGIGLTLFHGRGGSIARGGGPAAKAILAQPCGLRDGKIRITEQGEVLSTRYHDPDLAHRILEQVACGVLLGSAAAQKDITIPGPWRQSMTRMSAAGLEAYQLLVHRDPGFLQFWKAATPIDEISSLRLGSRPAFRKATNSVEDLRAIPWVFSWMQSRFNFPGWYGLGTALESELNSGGEEILREMYRDWTFFQTTIDNAQLSLVKADMPIARIYAGLVKDVELRDRIFGIIESEFKRTVAAILRITGRLSLLEKEKVLQRSIQLRNPYIDPLNYLQVEMIRRLRSQRDLGGKDDEALRSVIELTINGVSGGLKNTG